MRLREQSRRYRRRSAFTLMEMLVVVAIIVALAGIGTYYLIGALTSSTRDAARMGAVSLEKACFTYKMKHHAWPDSLQTLLQADSQTPALLEPNDLKDPFGGTYTYEKSGPMNQGRKPDIYAIDTSDGSKWGNWAPQ
jgi:general secretion pathway protein G